MVCDTRLRNQNQTKQERSREIQRAIEKLTRELLAGRVKVKVGPNGAVAFQGWKEEDKDGVSDECAMRKLMQSGNMLVKAAFAQAEALAGRKINSASGYHAHGDTWHKNH